MDTGYFVCYVALFIKNLISFVFIFKVVLSEIDLCVCAIALEDMNILFRIKFTFLLAFNNLISHGEILNFVN